MSLEEYAANIVHDAASNPLRASVSLLVVARDLVNADPILRVVFARQLMMVAFEMDGDLKDAPQSMQ